MKTFINFLSYLAHFILEWELFQTKVLEKIKTHVLCSTFFFPRKSCLLWCNVEKCCTAGQAMDDNIIRRMRIACLITTATDTHSEYVILIAFPLQRWLNERASALRFTYFACIVVISTKLCLLWWTVLLECFISVYWHIGVWQFCWNLVRPWCFWIRAS